MPQIDVRIARCSLPTPHLRRFGGHLLPSEESATLLLWAFPRLLGWSRAVNWLFSPVTGRSRYPGDLWGVDSQGDLLIVETKLSRDGRAQDPFADFVKYPEDRDIRKLWTADRLQQRWYDLLKQERTFDLSKVRRKPNATLPGVLPYSSRRDAVRCWRETYAAHIRPTLDESYERAVKRSLGLRRSRVSLTPVFIGLIAAVPGVQPGLSSKGEEAWRKLVRRVGKARVRRAASR